MKFGEFKITQKGSCRINRNPAISANSSDSQIKVSASLSRELKRLVDITGFGHHLVIRYEPRENSQLDGEVQDNTIWIYCNRPEGALGILRHEFCDWILVQGIRQYEQIINVDRQIINSIFRHLQHQAYEQKEKAVDAFVKLIEVGDRINLPEGGHNA